MDIYKLNLNSSVLGGYFSSEQIDLLSIIQCNSSEELKTFIERCDQINNINGIKNICDDVNENNLEEYKRKIFKIYQDTMVYHAQSKDASRIMRFKYLGISPSDMMSIIEGKHDDSERIIKLNHHYISEERDQNKSLELYDELTFLNSQLSNFNTMLIGSGKIYNVVNKYFVDKEKKYDFYHAERDLDFAYRNGKQVRFHSLLVKDDYGLFNGKSKDEILYIIKEYVRSSIDFINKYNENHKIMINGKEESVINAVDLFNEIVSFDKMIFDKDTNKWYEYKRINNEYKVVIDEDKGMYRDLKDGEIPEYQNIWYVKYGIEMDELMDCFQYALENKSEGISFLYNEPFLEDEERRKKVFEILKEIDFIKPGLIDTLGSQMHTTIGEDLNKIRKCFEAFREFQIITGKKIQITEFDMSIGSKDIEKVFGPNATYSLEDVYNIKEECINAISEIIKLSGVDLSGISYWSLTDLIDCNLERLRSKELRKEIEMERYDIKTACGGLFPTHKKLIKQQNNRIINY